MNETCEDWPEFLRVESPELATTAAEPATTAAELFDWAAFLERCKAGNQRPHDFPQTPGIAPSVCVGGKY